MDDQKEIQLPTPEALAEGMLDATKPIPGLEGIELRYAGNEKIGFFPCMPDGSVMGTPIGLPIVLPTMAHLKMWVCSFIRQQQRQASNIVIPTLSVPQAQKN